MLNPCTNYNEYADYSDRTLEESLLQMNGEVSWLDILSLSEWYDYVYMFVK